MPTHKNYMKRCLELAKNGLGKVAPNPLVGSLIVHNDKIIAEGWHSQFGGPHAEAVAIAAAPKELLRQSTLYVNLEPCSHFGKTPPCADLIIENQIPEVVIANIDPFALVNGKGIKKLEAAGIKVIQGVMDKEAAFLNRRFFIFHLKKRPYIILKWAQTGDGFMAPLNREKYLISNEFSRMLNQKWRSEETAILVGTATAMYDNPQLNAREMSTRNPVRIVIDRDLKIPESYHLLDGKQTTWVFTAKSKVHSDMVRYIPLNFSKEVTSQICNILFQEGIQSLIVEGGAMWLDMFIKNNLWDEARVFTSNSKLFEGISAPRLPISHDEEYTLKSDKLNIYYHA